MNLDTSNTIKGSDAISVIATNTGKHRVKIIGAVLDN
jgi:hypothetical protein